MTEDRYMQWKDEIAKARADNDEDRLSTIQLDYNIELGECLAHQSQRTKDLQKSIFDMKTDLSNIGSAVSAIGGRVGLLEAAVVKTADNVSTLAISVQALVDYKRDTQMHKAGMKAAGRILRWAIGGIAVLVSWTYAVYQAVRAYYGN